MINTLKDHYGQGQYGIRHIHQHDIILPWRFRTKDDAEVFLVARRWSRAFEVFDASTLSTRDRTVAYDHH